MTPRDAGCAKAESRLTEDERLSVYGAIFSRHFENGEHFSAENVRPMLSAGLQEKLDAFPNAIGAIILGLAKRKLIRAVGYVHSTRPERRKGKVTLWEVV